MTQSVRWLVGRSVCHYSLMGGKLNLHAPVGALIAFYAFPEKFAFISDTPQLDLIIQCLNENIL